MTIGDRGWAPREAGDNPAALTPLLGQESLMRALVLTSLALVACGGPAADADPIRLSWTPGQMFHTAARYRVAGEKTEKIAESLEVESTPTFDGDHWTDEVVWSWQVVETGTVPTAGDDLYDFAVLGDGTVGQLDVVRAWVDVSLNDDPELLEADPVVYLVFRADNDRLAGVVQFVNVEGERIERSWTTHQLGRDASALSRSMVTMLPTFLAPFGTTWAGGERTLEDGSVASASVVTDGVVDVAYDDALGGGLVVSRYEEGQPWPVATIADNVEARLLDANEVERRKRDLPPMLPEPPEDFDYVAALRASVNLDAALTLDADTIDGGWNAEVYEDFHPWAGSWWPQSKGALVFGYDNRQTISSRIKATVDPLKTDLDKLDAELRKLDSASADYAKKLADYQAKQKTLVDALVKFYDAVLQDLNGGRLKIEGTSIKHVDGWTYPLDQLSPMDKLALHLWKNGEKSPNPFYGPAWEILNHYSPGGGSWWGHCNGWSAAAILTNEPTKARSVAFGTGTISYTTADLKGLLSESHYSTYSNFYGARYNGKPTDDIADLSPKAFHTLVSHYLRDRKVPFVFDSTANEEVWNFPVYGVELAVEERTAGGGAGLLNVNTATWEQIDALAPISTTVAKAVVTYRETYGAFQKVDDLIKVKGIGAATLKKVAPLVTVAATDGKREFYVIASVTYATDGVDVTHIDNGTPESFTEDYAYTLFTDANGQVLSGTWADPKKHPDFAWVPYENPIARSSGGSENPYLPYGSLLKIVGDDLRRK